MNIFVDDERVPPEGFTRFMSGEEFLKSIDNINTHVHILSFDHDLGLGLNGYETIKELINNHINFVNNVDKILIHSSNIVAREQMLSYLLSAQKSGIISKNVFIAPQFYQYTLSHELTPE